MIHKKMLFVLYLHNIVIVSKLLFFNVHATEKENKQTNKHTLLSLLSSSEKSIEQY